MFITIIIQDIDDIIILSIHIMIEKPERVKTSAYIVKNSYPFSSFFNYWFLC